MILPRGPSDELTDSTRCHRGDRVAAGLLDCLSTAGEVTRVAMHGRVERVWVTTRQELEAMRTGNVGLQERLEHTKTEIELLFEKRG